MKEKPTKSSRKKGSPVFHPTGSAIPINSQRTQKINRQKCPHCQEHPYSRALVPCGHLLCDLCILEFEKGQKCPLCQTIITGKL